MNITKQLLVLLTAAFAVSTAHALDMADDEIGLLLGGALGSSNLVGSSKDLNPLIGARANTKFGSDFEFFGDLAYVPYKGNLATVGDSKVTTLRGGAEWFVVKEPKYNWFISGALGVIDVRRDIGSDADFHRQMFSLGFGQVWGVGANDSFRWELRREQSFGDGNLTGAWLTNIQALVGYSWGLGKPADFDGDGVPNRFDKCPNTPLGAKVDAHGCPIDSDGDGVPDGLDKCPNTPPGVKVDESGCPLDSDGDGVPDYLDKCPNTPPGVKVDANGCPLDSDGDGVPDYLDKCPNTPPGVKVDANGCPPDSDGDGVPDYLDKCPNTPPGVKVDANGCPVESAPKKLVLEGVRFANDSAVLNPEADEILGNAASTLKQWGDVRVEVAGYTDSASTHAHNLALSSRRADAVRDYLISKGVDAARLTAKGYGDSNPIADNGTAEGRGKNRRVELIPQQ